MQATWQGAVLRKNAITVGRNRVDVRLSSSAILDCYLSKSSQKMRVEMRPIGHEGINHIDTEFAKKSNSLVNM